MLVSANRRYVCMDGCRVLGGLFYYGHVHGEDLYGRTIRELNEDPRFHKRGPAGASLVTRV
jgi:hypothetical protein